MNNYEYINKRIKWNIDDLAEQLRNDYNMAIPYGKYPITKEEVMQWLKKESEILYDKQG